MGRVLGRVHEGGGGSAREGKRLDDVRAEPEEGTRGVGACTERSERALAKSSAAHDGDVYDAGGGHRRASDLGPLGKLRHDKSMSRGNHPVTAGSGQRVALQNPATADPYSRQSTR